MKRNAKRTGSGGRLRLGLLLATAAAFLLVPASQAFAAPHLKVNITTQPGASGNVTSNEVATGAPYTGEPTMECNSPSKEGDVCENLFEEVIHPLTEEFLFYREALDANPGPESVVGKWEVVNGEVHNGCEEGIPNCTVKTLENGQSEEDVEVNIEFENEVPKLTLNLIGINGGGGEVVSPSELFPLAGEPPMECVLEEGASEQTGICKNEMEEGEPGLFGEGLEAFPGPNSELVKWEFISGFRLGETCGEGQAACIAVGGSDVEIDVIFACEEGKFCPPKPEHALEVTTSGSGSGTVECSINGGGAGECPAVVEEESEVEVIATPGTGSEPAVLSGTGSAAACAASPCSFEMEEPSSVDAKFDLETLTLTTEAFGNGEVSTPGGIACTEAENGNPACEEELAYGTNVVVTADPDELNSVESLTGSGSASVCGGVFSPEEVATCEFEIKADSGVAAIFALAEGQESKTAKVHGFTPQNTTLEFTEDEEGNDCSDVDLGTFLANAQEDVIYAKTCGLIVTATGAENVLSAEDESETSTGHLVNSGYELTQPLETQAEGLPELLFPGEGGGTLASLESPVTLLTYGGPVNSDIVTLEFSQLIKEHDPLYTGEYAKTITLTLKQTVL